VALEVVAAETASAAGGADAFRLTIAATAGRREDF
jgi:hypothetical protein